MIILETFLLSDLFTTVDFLLAKGYDLLYCTVMPASIYIYVNFITMYVVFDAL